MKILGFTEEIVTCSMCGKSELKGTYAIELDDNSIIYLGSSCVKKRFHLTQKEFTSKINELYNKNLKLANEEWEASNEYKMSLPVNNFEFGSEEFDAIYNEQTIIENIKRSKIEVIRVKYNIEKKHFSLNYRKL